MGVCNCSMFCCTLLYVHSSIAIILMGKRELVALLNLSTRCLVVVERLFLAVPQGCLRFVIVVFPDQTHSFFYIVVDDPLDSAIKLNADLSRIDMWASMWLVTFCLFVWFLSTHQPLWVISVRRY